MDLSVVIPCLNESETLQICIDKVKKQLKENYINGEIIIADNGSVDGSIEIAKKNNVSIVNVKIKGYGSALRSGISAAKGKYIFIADADNSYDFNEISRFYKKICEGFDLIQGCRLSSGGGKIEKGAMPITHRIIGNPLFSFITKKIFKIKLNDVYCGMKIFKKESYEQIFFFSNGMVFCLEILIKFHQFKFKINELPITLYRDGRIKGKSHLKTISDGLKTLKFILIFSPKWIFFVPSSILLITSFIGLSHFFHFADQNYDKNINSISIFLILIFFTIQLIMLGLYASLRSESLGFVKNKKVTKFFKFFSLSKALMISFLGIVFSTINYYANFLNFLNTENNFIFNLLLLVIFINLLFSSLFVALLKENN